MIKRQRNQDAKRRKSHQQRISLQIKYIKPKSRWELLKYAIFGKGTYKDESSQYKNVVDEYWDWEDGYQWQHEPDHFNIRCRCLSEPIGCSTIEKNIKCKSPTEE